MPLCAVFVFGCIHGECIGVMGFSGKLGETSGTEWQGTHLEGSVGGESSAETHLEFAPDPHSHGGATVGCLSRPTAQHWLHAVTETVLLSPYAQLEGRYDSGEGTDTC